MSEPGFAPDWCLAPSETLREWLEDNGLSVRVAVACAASRPDRDAAAAMVQEVLDRKPLTRQHAELLFAVTGVSVQFWLNYEHNYRAGLAAGLVDASD